MPYSYSFVYTLLDKIHYQSSSLYPIIQSDDYVCPLSSGRFIVVWNLSLYERPLHLFQSYNSGKDPSGKELLQRRIWISTGLFQKLSAPVWFFRLWSLPVLRVSLSLSYGFVDTCMSTDLVFPKISPPPNRCMIDPVCFLSSFVILWIVSQSKKSTNFVGYLMRLKLFVYWLCYSLLSRLNVLMKPTRWLDSQDCSISSTNWTFISTKILYWRITVKYCMTFPLLFNL